MKNLTKLIICIFAMTIISCEPEDIEDIGKTGEEISIPTYSTGDQEEIPDDKKM